MREIHVSKDNARALINKFIPYSKNFVRILAYNGGYNGPPSETLAFNTPEGSECTLTTGCQNIPCSFLKDCSVCVFFNQCLYFSSWCCGLL
jgi:hypothetical protein